MEQDDDDKADNDDFKGCIKTSFTSYSQLQPSYESIGSTNILRTFNASN